MSTGISSVSTGISSVSTGISSVICGGIVSHLVERGGGRISILRSEIVKTDERYFLFILFFEK